MFGIKKNKTPQKNGVVVLKKTREGECGGTDATLDTKAPKTINSTEMTLFDVTSALPFKVGDDRDERLGFVSAFAAPVKGGSFLYLETGEFFQRRAPKEKRFAVVEEDVFGELVGIVNGFDLAKSNGFHSVTHGLPENFGGEIDIRYASGERIGVSDNQSPVISAAAGKKIAETMNKRMSGRKLPLGDVSDLKSILFEEERKDGGFTKSLLRFKPDGKGEFERASRYDGPKVFESRSEADEKKIAEIKETVNSSGILAWETLPDRGYTPMNSKKLTFTFADGNSVTVPDGKLTPDGLSGGFFEIELRMR
ncbi:MAG: hypothetical protein IJV00_00945 [Clostridia bacterium]|nr:hypothetical protein [Clostridia bacterium]